MALEFASPGERKQAMRHPVLSKATSVLLSGHHTAEARRLNFSWRLTAKTPTFQSHVTVPDDSGEPLHLDYLKATPTGMGHGPVAFARIVAAAKEHGFKKIEMHAARTSTMNGYYTWPLLGADGPLPRPRGDETDLRPGVRWDALGEAFPGVRTIRELLSRPGGAAWWKEHGWSLPLTFHTDDTGALMHYLTRRRK